MEKLRAGKTKQQVEQVREFLETKERLFVYGLLEPNRYLDQLGSGYSAKEIHRTEFNIETQEEVKELVGHVLWKTNKN